jgi:hypothetical protein
MKKGPIVAGISLALVASFALPPIAAAGGRVGGHAFAGRVGGHGFVGRPFASHGFVHHPFVGRPFFPHHFFRPFVPFGVGVAVIAPPLYAYAAPPAYYSAPPYYDSSSYAPPVSYAPPATYAPPAGGTISVAPSPPPMQTVVEYPNGRYELRGDGVTTPYKWFWIPNPPPAPPSAPPSSAPPAGAPTPGDPPSGPHSKLYRWLDSEGTVHLTDSLDSVPKQYRAQAKQAPSS